MPSIIRRDVSIVLPLYKPQAGWAERFAQDRSLLNATLPHVSFAYIIVHDGPVCSQIQQEAEWLKKACSGVAFHSYSQNKGKGHALRYGVQKASGQFILLMDFDFPYEVQCIRELIGRLEEGYEVVTGRRTQSYYTCLPLKRKLISRSYTICNRLLFTLPVYDTQSGLKGFNKKGKAVFLQTAIDRFLVDTEFLLRASLQGLTVNVINIDLRPNITFSNFGYRVLKTELWNLVSLVRLQRRLKQRKAGISGPGELLSFAFRIAKMSQG